ncbi:MAG TPA: hypothetical protein VJV78_45740 [Polyangiales bacterium]|nr:hypothetical protein [Polyangiales bacterium]
MSFKQLPLMHALPLLHISPLPRLSMQRPASQKASASQSAMFEQLVLHWLPRPGMQMMSLNAPQSGPFMPVQAASFSTVMELQTLSLHCATTSVPVQVCVLQTGA